MGGVDSSPKTWLSRWTLMDLFLVLIAAISFFKLWHWRMGLASLILLGLIWHEPGAPRYVWLNILAASALIRVLPLGIFKKLAQTYLNIAFIALLLIAIPFMVNQVKHGIYPQLELPWQRVMPVMTDLMELGQAVSPQAPMAVKGQAARSRPKAMESLASKKLAGTGIEKAQIDAMAQQSAMLNTIDPNAMVQTGPGIPQWSWRSVPFSWNGPVSKDQRISLVLMSPMINLVANFLRVALLLMVGVFLLKWAFHKQDRQGGNIIPNAAVLVTAILLVLTPQAIGADFPNPELLNELKTRLLTPPDCFPECGQISRMNLEIDDNILTLRLEIHAGASVALPLPGKSGQWLPTQMMLDGEDTATLTRFGQGLLWVKVDEGIHQAVMSGPLPLQENVQLPLPLKPHFVTVNVRGWTVKGIREDFTADDHLQLERIPEKTTSSETHPMTASPILPPFVKIERILHLGLDWSVETRITRVSTSQAAVVIEVPLLSGESVTLAGFPVKNGKVEVNLAPDQRAVTWQSALDKQSPLTLTAPETTTWTEIWKADVSTIWHTEYKGLTVIHHQDTSGHWLPEWRPWPGESVTITTLKPQGVSGTNHDH